MSMYSLIIWALLGQLVFSQVVAAAVVDNKKVAPVEVVLQILNDPLIPERVRGASLMKNGPDSDGWSNYDLVDTRKSSAVIPAYCSIKDSGNATFQLILLLMDDVAENTGEPSWDNLQPVWDKFIGKYWPQMQRTNDWKEAIRHYNPGRGVFSITYALIEHNVEMGHLELDIRLADGQIGGISLQDDRPLLQEKQSPPGPPRSILLKAVQQSLGVMPQHVQLFHLTIRHSERVMMRNGNIYDSLSLTGDTRQGNHMLVGVRYDEKARTVVIGRIQDARESVQNKPVTTILDDRPFWSPDGKQLYFTTTRDVLGRPWWQKASTVTSIAMCEIAQRSVISTALIRPIKPKGSDYYDYEAVAVNPTGQFLISTLNRSQIIVIGMKSGTVVLPDRDSKWYADTLRLVRFPSLMPEGVRWKVSGCTWLPQKEGLIMSLQEGIDKDLYLAHWADNELPGRFSLKPLVSDTGDDILPTISNVGKSLCWMHQDPKTKLWQFVVADFDPGLQSVGVRRSVHIDGDPRSITWDALHQRWLAVTSARGGSMFWLKQLNNGVAIVRVQDLKWGTNLLTPTSASVSPDGKCIAVAAVLSRSHLYAEAGSIVVSGIFVWDGMAEQVVPLLGGDMGFKRFRYNAQGESWAHIRGNVNKFDIITTADPTYFLKDNTATDGALMLPQTPATVPARSNVTGPGKH